MTARDYKVGVIVNSKEVEYTRALIDLYVDMAIQTNDKDWFIWLGKLRKYMVEREEWRKANA